jgi:hypothetical protein
MSFKKALVIVLVLHGALYGFFKLRSYSDKMAREVKYREIASRTNDSADIWNNQGRKLQVVAVPKPKIKKEEKSFKDYFVNTVAYAINKSREFYGMLLTIPPVIDYQAKDTIDKIEKKINKPVQSKPIIKPKSKSVPSPTPFVTVVYKHTRVIEQDIIKKAPKITREEMNSIYIPESSSLPQPRLRPVKLCPPPNFN